jgi:hypothetical protein
LTPHDPPSGSVPFAEESLAAGAEAATDPDPDADVDPEALTVGEDEDAAAPVVAAVVADG